MVTVELGTTPTANPLPSEKEKTDSHQEVADPEHYVKHPLQNRWAFCKTWQTNLLPISRFDRVEDFGVLYSHS
uniref:Uncharacterized protein n=1 Tax=Spermophilus dauricus TaxID=99837 RepID=A0A8C9UQL8_SPEDA